MSDEEVGEVRLVIKFIPQDRDKRADALRESLKNYLLLLTSIATEKRNLPPPVLEAYNREMVAVRARIPISSAEKIMSMMKSLAR